MRLCIYLLDVNPPVTGWTLCRHVSKDRAPIGLAGATAPLFPKVGFKVFTDMEIPILLVGINGRYKKKIQKAYSSFIFFYFFLFFVLYFVA